MSLFTPPSQDDQLQTWMQEFLRIPFRIIEGNFAHWQNGVRMLYGSLTAEKLALLNSKTHPDPETGEQRAITAEIFEGSRALTAFLLIQLGAMTPQGQLLPEMALNEDGSPKLGADGVTQLRNWKNSDMVNRILQVIASIPRTTTHPDGTVTLDA